MVGTPWVSNTSNVFGISKIDLTPAQTTATGVYPNSIKSADISKVFSPSLCTPPIPPVTNILMPARFAKIMVAATVVEPSIYFIIEYARSLLEHFITSRFSIFAFDRYSNCYVVKPM